jgi:hypothetical protein
MPKKPKFSNPASSLPPNHDPDKYSFLKERLEKRGGLANPTIELRE